MHFDTGASTLVCRSARGALHLGAEVASSCSKAIAVSAAVGGKLFDNGLGARHDTDINIQAYCERSPMKHARRDALKAVLLGAASTRGMVEPARDASGSEPAPIARRSPAPPIGSMYKRPLPVSFCDPGFPRSTSRPPKAATNAPTPSAPIAAHRYTRPIRMNHGHMACVWVP
jgi:hypothetical protein